MSNAHPVSFETTLHVRDHCLCLRAQRGARILARLFDEAFRPLDLTNGQFSLMMSLNRPGAPSIGATASFLAMDRTTLTAALKPLERRGLVVVTPAPTDRRTRTLALTDAGRALLAQAVPIWQRAHADLDRRLGADGAHLREGLEALAGTDGGG